MESGRQGSGGRVEGWQERWIEIQKGNFEDARRPWKLFPPKFSHLTPSPATNSCLTDREPRPLSIRINENITTVLLFAWELDPMISCPCVGSPAQTDWASCIYCICLFADSTEFSPDTKGTSLFRMLFHHTCVSFLLQLETALKPFLRALRIHLEPLSLWTCQSVPVLPHALHAPTKIGGPRCPPFIRSVSGLICLVRSPLKGRHEYRCRYNYNLQIFVISSM